MEDNGILFKSLPSNGMLDDYNKMRQEQNTG
jgi:hypothetical protein